MHYPKTMQPEVWHETNDIETQQTSIDGNTISHILNHVLGKYDELAKYTVFCQPGSRGLPMCKHEGQALTVEWILPCPEIQDGGMHGK